MKKKNKINENYLEMIPRHKEGLKWSADEEGKVTLDVENKGIMKRITQIILFKPKVSHIHLDDLGSFIWQQIDGKKKILDMGDAVKESFGEEAEPLYPRLATFVKTLEGYGFVTVEKI